MQQRLSLHKGRNPSLWKFRGTTLIYRFSLLNADQTGNLTLRNLIQTSGSEATFVRALRDHLSADGSSSLADACALLLFFTAFSYGTYDSIFTQICQEANSLLFTHCANSNRFCRCFAFQIRKIFYLLNQERKCRFFLPNFPTSTSPVTASTAPTRASTPFQVIVDIFHS